MKLSSMTQGFLNAGGGLIDLVFPLRCAVCGIHLCPEDRVICSDCQSELERIVPPICCRCGQPYAGISMCPDCQLHLPPCEQIRSLLVFAGTSQQAMWRIKISGKLTLIPLFAELLAHSDLRGLELGNHDFLVPVPLHPKKLATRGFNQASLLAVTLSKIKRIKVAPFHLIRTRKTLSQSQMPQKRDRFSNMAGAFAVKKNHPFSQKRILLVDDVVTTGATLGACATALLDAGAQLVHAVTIARTVHPDSNRVGHPCAAMY